MRFSFLLFLFFTGVHASPHCGFARMLEHQAVPQAARTLPSAALTSCQAEQLYDSSRVQVHLTEHFRIYFTTEGPHAVPGSSSARPPYIDTLAQALEKAWQQQTQESALLPPLGTSRTYHYQRADYPHLYPVEVIDMTLLRDTDQLLGGPCYSCYGLTFASSYQPADASQLFIDNDFLYAAASDPVITRPGEGCTYTQAATPIVSNGQNYHQEWTKGLRVTATHELYHASQIRYLDYRLYSTFWFEASATGREEIGVPDINDYWQYLPNVFQSPGMPVTRNFGLYPYGQATLPLYLYATQGAKFDTRIWESFARSPRQDFPHHLQRVAQSQGSQADSLFHDYAVRMFFSGDRHAIRPWEPFSDDQQGWPTWTPQPSTAISALDTAAFLFARIPVGSYAGFASDPDPVTLLLWNQDQRAARAYRIADFEELRRAEQDLADTALLVISRLFSLSERPVAGSLRAWPNPWNGQGSVCFGPLQESVRAIEIRSADGLPVTRLPRQGERTCWDGTVQNQRVAPGVFHWRTLPHGKNQVLLVIF